MMVFSKDAKGPCILDRNTTITIGMITTMPGQKFGDIRVKLYLCDLLEGLGRDLNYGVRLLARSPGFTLAATVCLGIGIGLATSTFTQFKASVFKKTPGVGEPDALVSFQSPVPFPDFEEYRDLSGQFESAAAFLAPVPFVISSVDGRPERIWGHIVTPDYFRVLRVKASAGRLFGPEEMQPGATGVVISHRLWTTRFGANRDLIGGTLRINGQAVRVLGVAGPDFRGATPLLAVADIWLPTTAPTRIAPELQGDILRDRTVKTFLVTGRLKAGVTAASAEAALDGVARRIEEVNDEPDRQRGGRRVTLLPGGRVFPVRDQDLPKVSALPTVMVGLILVVACANVATMLVARAAARQREIAIRLSLGASRARLVRQLLTESVLLGLLGGAAGLLFTVGYHALLSRFLAVLPSQMLYEWQVDWRSFVSTFVVAGVSTVLFGLAPALQAARADITPALKGGAASRPPRVQDGSGALELQTNAEPDLARVLDRVRGAVVGPLRGKDIGVGVVVTRVGTGDRNAIHADRLAVADILVGEARRGITGRQYVASQAIVRERHGRVGRSVVNLVYAGGADGQGGPGDIGRVCGRGRGQHVVAGVGSS